VVHRSYKYRLRPSAAVAAELDRHRDICRQVYNHFLHRLNEHGGVPEMTALRGELPDLKTWWDDLSDVYSRTLQVVVERLYHNLDGLHELKQNGYGVGQLRWKAPDEYRSFTYSQRGFDVDKNTGRDGYGELQLSKIGTVPIRLHRDVPEDAAIKQVTIKKEKTGEWYAVLGIEFDRAVEKPDDPDKCVGIDAGIVKQTHDSDGVAVEPPDLSAERDRLERAQRDLSRKEHGSNNWEEQRRVVARRHADLKRKRRDFLHKLSSYYAREYDLVAVEDLDAKGLVELPGNSGNRASAAWATFKRMLEYKCEREGTHFVAVDPAGTTKECAECGVGTDKPLWVREHSCPACGFTADRDANAAVNILSRGLDAVGTGRAESTPPETAVPTETTTVSANRVIERGSPGRNERTASAVSE
jgi:putative transposase